MKILAGLFEAAIRVLLWITIAFAAGWATLLMFEQLIHAEVFSVDALASTWLLLVWILTALAVGNTTAYGCDRVYTRQRQRSRSIGRQPARHA